MQPSKQGSKEPWKYLKWLQLLRKYLTLNIIHLILRKTHVLDFWDSFSSDNKMHSKNDVFNLYIFCLCSGSYLVKFVFFFKISRMHNYLSFFKVTHNICSNLFCWLPWIFFFITCLNLFYSHFRFCVFIYFYYFKFV